jgi:hypothetical protein
MSEIVLITDFSNTSEKKLILKKLIRQINSKYKICIASHCVLPFDIVEDVDFYFYDKNNPFITDNSLKGKRFFANDDFYIMHKSYFFPSSHVPAILRLWQLPLSFLKNAEYKIVHVLEYDALIKDLSILEINKSKLENNDVVIYESDRGNIIGNLISINLEKFHFETFEYNYKKIFDLYKKVHLDSDLFSSERTVYELLFENQKVLKLNHQELEKFLDFGKCEIMSENILSKIAFTFFRSGDDLNYFIHNGTSIEVSLDLIINDNFFTNLKIQPKTWNTKKVEITDIKNAKAFINDIKYFNIDFTIEENLTLINDVEIMYRS